MKITTESQEVSTENPNEDATTETELENPENTENPDFECSVLTPFDVIEGMKTWCEINCKLGYCPASICKC